jgi:hypothetical protein
MLKQPDNQKSTICHSDQLSPIKEPIELVLFIAGRHNDTAHGCTGKSVFQFIANPAQFEFLAICPFLVKSFRRIKEEEL